MEISCSPFLIFLLIILNALNLRGDSDYFVDEKEWIEPDSLSRIWKMMGKELRNPVQARNEGNVKCDELSVLTEELKSDMQSPSDSSAQLYDLKYLSSSRTPLEQKNSNMISEQQSQLYMKRFINILLKVSKLNEDMQQNLEAHLHIRVTPKQLTVLQQFSKGSNDVTLQELDSVLSSVLFSSTLHVFEDYIQWSIMTDFLPSREVLVELAFGCIFMFLMWKVLNGHSMFLVMMIFLALAFAVSFLLTYHRMLKQAEIKQYAAMKVSPEVPPGCQPDQTWAQSFNQWLSPVDCVKYYESVSMDPSLEVTPALVLSEMIAGFFLHPMGTLGSSIAEFANNILGNLPFGVNYIVLFASLYCLVLIICVSCGARMRLPYYLGGVELSGPRRQDVITAGPQMSQGVGQVDQLPRPSAVNDTVNNLIQIADTGLVIMSASGMQKLLSSGNSAAVHRDESEKIQAHSSKVSQHSMHEENRELKTHVPGCCGESQSGSHHYAVNETVAAVRQLPQQPLRESLREEPQLRQKAVLSELEVKPIQIQCLEEGTDCTGGVQEKDLALADEKKPTFGTGHSSEILETNIENDLTRHKSDNSDGSDDDISFVKL